MNTTIISTKLHPPPSNFYCIHKVLSDPRLFPYIGSFIWDKVLFKLYRISKYHYSIRVNQKLHDTYRFSDLLNHPKFGFIVQSLSEIDNSNFSDLLLYKCKDEEVKKVLLRNLFLKTLNLYTEDYITEVKENRVLIPTLFQNYYNNLQKSTLINTQVRDIIDSVQIEQIFLINNSVSDADIFIQLISAGVPKINCKLYHRKFDESLFEIYDPEEYNSEDQLIRFPDVFSSNTKVLKIQAVVYLSHIHFDSLVELTIEALRINSFDDPDGILIGNRRKSFYSELYLIKTLRKFETSSIYCMDTNIRNSYKEVLPEDLAELKFRDKIDRIPEYIDYMISRLSKLEKLESTSMQYNTVEFSKLKKLKSLMIFSTPAKIFPDSIQELFMNQIQDFFPDAINLKILSFGFRTDNDLSINLDNFKYPLLEELSIRNYRAGDLLDISFLPESLLKLDINAHQVKINMLPKKLRSLLITAFILQLSVDFTPELRELYLRVQNLDMTPEGKEDRNYFSDFPTSLDRIDLNLDDRSDWTIKEEFVKKNIFVRGFRRLAKIVTGKKYTDRTETEVEKMEREYMENIQKKIDKYIKEKKLLGYKIKTGSFDDGSAQIDPQLAKAYLEEKKME